MKGVKISILIAAAALFIAACGQAATTNNNIVVENKAAAPAPAEPSATIDQAEFAKGLYAKNCAICHKDSGKGGKVTVDGKTIEPDDITTAKMKGKTDEKLYEYISEGFPDDGMPAFKEKLNADQIKAVVRHVRVLQGGDGILPTAPSKN
jgi:mono/diheme cytochrome c family protein